MPTYKAGIMWPFNSATKYNMSRESNQKWANLLHTFPLTSLIQIDKLYDCKHNSTLLSTEAF